MAATYSSSVRSFDELLDDPTCNLAVDDVVGECRPHGAVDQPLVLAQRERVAGVLGAPVADAVVSARPEALQQRELALEQLTPAPDGASRIPRGDEGGRIGRQPVADPSADLLIERLEDAGAFGVRRLRLIGHLRVRRLPREQQQHGHEPRTKVPSSGHKLPWSPVFRAL